MPQSRPDGRYLCTKDELEALLHSTCEDFADTLGVPLNERECRVLRREIQGALDFWHASAVPIAPPPIDDGHYRCTPAELHDILEGFGAALIEMTTVYPVDDVADAVVRALIDNAVQAWHADANPAIPPPEDA